MPYVQRDADGKIIGIYGAFQESYAEEELPDDDAEVVAFLAPKPQPRLVLKRVIVDRLYAAGKLEAARAALDAQSLYTKERWNSRDAVFASDPDTIALLKAIGADVAAILAE